MRAACAMRYVLHGCVRCVLRALCAKAACDACCVRCYTAARDACYTAACCWLHDCVLLDIRLRAAGYMAACMHVACQRRVLEGAEGCMWTVRVPH
jgi:hypothetical protein